MSFLNGLSGLGAGLNVFAGNAAKDAMDAMDQPARTPLLSSAPPAAPEATPPPAPDAPAPDAAPAADVPVAKPGGPVVALADIHPDLARIASPGGVKFTVASSAVDKFQGLITELEQAGYKIDPATSGGYNPRNIAGTNTPSQHAYGLAVDVNSQRNARGTQGEMPPELARALASKYGLTWGGDWHGATRDPMHFEVGASS